MLSITFSEYLWMIMESFMQGQLKLSKRHQRNVHPYVGRTALSAVCNHDY